MSLTSSAASLVPEDLEALMFRIGLLDRGHDDDEAEEASEESSSKLASQAEYESIGQYEAAVSESDRYSVDFRAAAMANEDMKIQINSAVETAAQFIQEQLGKPYLKYGEKTAALENYIRSYVLAYCSFKTLDAPTTFCMKFACDAVEVALHKGKYNIPRRDAKPADKKLFLTKGKAYVDKNTQTETKAYAEKKTGTEADTGN